MTTMQGLVPYGTAQVKIGTLYVWAGVSRKKEDYAFEHSDVDFNYYCGLRRGYENIIRLLGMFDDYLAWYELNKSEL